MYIYIHTYICVQIQTYNFMINYNTHNNNNNYELYELEFELRNEAFCRFSFQSIFSLLQPPTQQQVAPSCCDTGYIVVMHWYI